MVLAFNKYRHLATLLAIACLMAFAPATAQAGTEKSVYTCARQAGYNPQPSDFTIVIITCIQGTILQAGSGFLSALSSYMTPVLGAVETLMIVILGLRMAGGEHGVLAKSYGLIIRMSIVTFVSYNLGSLIGIFFAIQDDITSMLCGGYSPWRQIDAFLGNFLGFGSGLMLYQGVIGIVGAAITGTLTGTNLGLGGIMFSTGFLAIMSILKFVQDLMATQTNNSAAITVLGITLSFTLPAAMSPTTERYPKKNVDLILAAILTMPMIFTAMYMFMGIFDYYIQKVFFLLGGHDFSKYWKMDNPVGSFLLAGDAPTHEKMKVIAKSGASTASPLQTLPPVQTSIYAMVRHAMNGGSLVKMPSIDLGKDAGAKMEQLSYVFIQLFIFSSIMKKFVYQMPALASTIVGVITQLPIQNSGSLRERAREATHNAALGIGALTGGWVGGEAGAKLSAAAKGNRRQRAVSRQVGGILGAYAGANKVSEAENKLWEKL